MKDVLVTGGAGFVGGHLVRALVNRGYTVTVFDDLSTGAERNVPKVVSLYVNDISQPLPELPAFDTCFHLAAVSRIGASFADRDRCHEVNVIGTGRVLELCRRNGARCVFASTSCCTDSPRLSPYAWSKLHGEEMCRNYAQVVARLFNVYGPLEPEVGPTSTVVARFARARRDDRPLVVHGDGQQRRDFVHVGDVVSALLVLAEKGTGGDAPYDVGTGVNYSVNEVAEMFSVNTVYEPLPPGQLRETRADPRRLVNLGWEWRHSLPEYVRSLT